MKRATIPKRGRRIFFKREEVLSRVFCKSLPVNLWETQKASSQHQMLTVKESTCSEGQADLVWGKLDSGLVKSHSKWASLLQQPTCSRIISLLMQEKLRFTELHARLGITFATLKSWINRLDMEGVIKLNADGCYSITGRVRFAKKAEICAFEFKLRNWKRALYQALRYKSFSHRVFVVMPQEFVQLALQNRRFFEHHNVGLISVDEYREARVLIQTKKQKPTTLHCHIMATGMLIERGVAKPQLLS